jgi:hypothetical protein
VGADEYPTQPTQTNRVLAVAKSVLKDTKPVVIYLPG